MFKNILIGQYIDTGSVLHNLDARTKMIITIILAAMIFTAREVISAAVITVVCVSWMIMSRLKITVFLRSIKPVLFLAAFTFVFDLLFTPGRRIFEIWLLHGTYEGLFLGTLTVWRLLLLVMTASALTLTTKPLDLTDGIERLLTPLSYLKVPTRDIAMMMGISIRFIPTLAEEMQRIIDAQKSRCADFDDGGLIKKAKAVIPLIIPLMVSAFRHSDSLASAMDARCYGAGTKRTRMRQSRITKNDIAAIAAAAVLMLATLLLEQF